MILRTASHAIAPPVTFDSLIPHTALRQTLHPTICHGRHTLPRCALHSSLAARRNRLASSSNNLTPGAFLTRLENKLRISECQPLATLTDTQGDMLNQTFQQLSSALNQCDLAQVSELWSVLKNRNLLVFFGPRQYNICSRAIVAYFRFVARRGPLTEGEKQILHEIALFVAGGGEADGLTTLMLHAIREQKPRDALALYDQYLERLREKGLLRGADAQPEQVEEPDWESKEATLVSSDPRPLSPIRDEVLLIAIVAHATLDTFSEALPMYLEAAVRIPHTTLETVLPLLPAHSRGKAEFYAHRLENTSLLSRPEALMKHLSNLTRYSSVNSLQKLYSDTIAGVSGSHAWIAVSPAQLSGTRTVLLPDFFWPSFIKSFLHVRRTDLAERLWDDMLRLGVVPQIVTWNALLDGYANMRSVDSVLSTWEIMLSSGVKPDALSYRALLHALHQANRIEDAQKHFEVFERDLVNSQASLDDSSVLAVYNTVLNGLLFASLEKPATAIMERMETKGPKPDIVTFNTFLRYYSRKGDLKGLARLLQKLEPAGVKADIFTFSTLLTAMLKIRPDADKMMINFMKKQGVAPDTTSLTAVIDRQLREGTEQSFKIAMDLLAKMERNAYDGVQPNAVTYTAVLAGINRVTWLDRQVAAEYRTRIWETMRSRSMTPTRSAYNILIKASLENREPEGVVDALAYYRDMRHQRVYMGKETWYILIRGLMDRGELGFASRVVADLEQLKDDSIASHGSLSRLIQKLSRALSN